MGGIGKTEVAIKLAEEIKPTKGAYLIHFQTSMRKTILRIHFSGYKYEPQEGLRPQEQEEKEYQERLDILRF